MIINKISDEQVRDFTLSLYRSFGRRTLPKELVEKCRMLFEAKQYSQMILEVKLYLKIRLTLRIGYLRNTEQIPLDKTVAPTMINIPLNMPHFGSREFDDMKIEMYINR